MSVFVFLGQDGVGKTRLAGFCQVRSRQKERPVTNFNTHIAFSERDELWIRQEWLKGVYGRCGQDMESWTGIQRFDRLDKDRLARTGMRSFEAGGTGLEHLWVLFLCF